jgi:hypothetical protein
VLVAEDLSGRYRTVIETLTEYLPLIAVELKTLQLDTVPPVATTFPVVFAEPDDLVVRPADEPGKDNGEGPVNDEENWKATKPEFTEAAKLMYQRVRPDVLVKAGFTSASPTMEVKSKPAGVAGQATGGNNDLSI